jgi:hypothetical protein
MSRPRLLLVPEFTEVTRTIKLQLKLWAEVASYEDLAQEMLERVPHELILGAWETLTAKDQEKGTSRATQSPTDRCDSRSPMSSALGGADPSRGDQTAGVHSACERADPLRCAAAPRS